MRYDRSVDHILEGVKRAAVRFIDEMIVRPAHEPGFLAAILGDRTKRDWLRTAVDELRHTKFTVGCLFRFC